MEPIMQFLFTVAELLLHPLNILARDGDKDALKRRVDALAKSIKGEGWRGDSCLTVVIGPDGKPYVIGGGTRLRALKVLSEGLQTIRSNGKEYTASEFMPPLYVETWNSEGEIAARINYLNAIDSGAAGFVPHSFHNRLTLALKALPKVDFISQGKYSAEQVRTACGIKESNGSEREFSSCILTLASYYGFTGIVANAVNKSNDARQLMGKKADTKTGETGGYIPQLETAVKTGKTETVQTIRKDVAAIMAGAWSTLLEGKPKPKTTTEKISEGVTAALTNRAALAESTIERYILEGGKLTQEERVAFDFLHANANECSKVAALAAPQVVAVAAHTEKKKGVKK